MGNRTSFSTVSAAVQSLGQGGLYLAVPDLHGRMDLLKALLRQVKGLSVRLVFLGDYIDRGPSFDLLNLILELEKTETQFVFLPGNHEWMCMQWFNDNQVKVKTQRWREVEAPRGTLMNEWVERKDVPNEQIQFLRRILRKRFHYSDKKNLLFVHAGIETSPELRSLEKMDPDHFLWSRNLPPGYQGPLLIHGHTFAGDLPFADEQEVNLETRCWVEANRPLTVGIFQDVPAKADRFLGFVSIYTT